MVLKTVSARTRRKNRRSKRRNPKAFSPVLLIPMSKCTKSSRRKGKLQKKTRKRRIKNKKKKL
jgi:hypothetical protein